MKQVSILFLALICLGLLTIGCNNSTSKNNIEENDSKVIKKELEDAISKMFENTTFTNAVDYFKTDVSNDYVMIGADGILENKEELLADTERLKMLEMATFKFFDQKIRIYGHVGIITGRSQAFIEGKYVAEFLYTAVFVKENENWMYTSWQGTWSKNTPPIANLIEKN